MITLRPFELSLRRVLINRARSTATALDVCITYLDLGKAVDPRQEMTYPMTRPPFRGIGEALGHVSMYEVEHGRPMLTALVVDAGTGVPGPGFAKLGRHLGFDLRDEEIFWTEQLASVLDFWRDPDPIRALDAALDRLISDLQVIKKRVA